MCAPKWVCRHALASMKNEHRRQLAIGWGVALVFCAGGVALVVWGFSRYADSREFVAGAQSAPGKVVGFKVHEGTELGSRDDIHYAMVQYRTADGRDIEFQGPSKDGLVKLKSGDDVRVLYYPDDPKNARVDSFMGLWFVPTILWAVGGGAIAIPLLTMWQATKEGNAHA